MCSRDQADQADQNLPGLPPGQHLTNRLNNAGAGYFKLPLA